MKCKQFKSLKSFVQDGEMFKVGGFPFIELNLL